MDDESVAVVRELTTSEELLKLVLGAVAGFMAKRLVENVLDDQFQKRRK